MSVFNGQHFLSEAVESILGQTLRDFEFLVIDDGSTDRTAEILARYASLDGRMRVLRHENKGRAVSLNIGIKLATAGYIARMDADDIALPDRLQAQVEFMERHPEVGLLGGAVELINTQGQVLRIVRPPLEDSEIRSLMLDNNPIWHPTVVMRKEVVLASGGYRKALLDADDYELWLRMSERSRLANLGEPVLQYRIHADQVSVRNLRHQVMCILAARAAASLRRRGSPDPLAHAEEVTPQLLDTLGVNKAQIRRALLNGYKYWMDVLERSDPEAALRVIDELLQLPASGRGERLVLANARLTAAGIHYRRGKLARALVLAGRGASVRALMGAPIDSIRGALRVALWHPLLEFTRPIRHALGLRQQSVRPPLKGSPSSIQELDKLVARPNGTPKEQMKMANSSDGVLIFDVGANIGDKTARFVANGARVVCFEPVPQCLNELRSRFEGHPLVTIVPCALGSSLGTLPMSICSSATTISTFSDDWKQGRFSDMVWDETLDVPVQPLDAAISEYGLPDYCKIDVEGFELAVLQGLSRPIPVLSFEFASEALSQTAACLERLEKLGYRRFNVAYGEFAVMRHNHWLGAEELMAELREHRSALVWGDIYAAQDQAPSRALAVLLPPLPVSEEAPVPESDTLDQLLWRGLAYAGVPVRLHLGSGEDFLPGYINIDHLSGPVQPDFSADIATLAFQRCSVDEVRVSRHVFERFNRTVALRLLTRYELWLKLGHLLLIETPSAVHSIQRKRWRNWRSLVDCYRIALSAKAMAKAVSMRHPSQ